MAGTALGRLAWRLRPLPSVRWETTLATAAIIALAAALRLYGLDRQSAWADEITTLFITDPGTTLGEFWARVRADAHPPLYYALMCEWSALFGQSDLAARLPSVLFGVLTVAAASAFPLATRARLALALLLALSPGGIEYAQEARSYAMLLFLATLVTGASLRFVGADASDARTAKRALAAMTAFGLLAAYTHYFGFLLALAAGGTALVASRHDPRRRAMVVLSLALTLALFLPWVAYHLGDMSYGRRQSAWIAAFPAGATVAWFLRLWLGSALAGMLLAVSVAWLLATGQLRRVARADKSFALAAGLAALTLVAALAASRITPVLTSRNLLVILPALYLAMAAMAEQAARRWGDAAMATVLGLLLLAMAEPLPWHYTALTKDQWRESAAFVLAQPGCHAGSIYVYGETPNYAYLIARQRPALQLISIPEQASAAASLAPANHDCAVLLWAADLSRDRFDALLAALSVPPRCLRVAAFYAAYVAVRDPACEIAPEPKG